jgi:hypothetical protein
MGSAGLAEEPRYLTKGPDDRHLIAKDPSLSHNEERRSSLIPRPPLPDFVFLLGNTMNLDLPSYNIHFLPRLEP